ncbi:MAG: GNAT family N-acetyltransferase [Clostridiales bacterium]|jgi:GNAT superfamily N-acetyltransferase|nr:GNAT family N-acetyltransferase [Clostridiales bacterium]
MLIKIIADKEVKAYLAFVEACFKVLGWEYGDYDKKEDEKILAAARDGKGVVWGMFDDNERLAGTVAVRELSDGSAELKRLYVLPKEQGKGYGGMLFKTAYDWALNNAYTLLKADTTTDRYASIHLLEGHGFKRTDDYNGNPFAELFYSLDIK